MSSEPHYPYPQHPFLLPVRDVAQILDTDLDKGLSSEQVREAQLRYKKNELRIGGGTPWQAILSKQFCNAMVMASDIPFFSAQPSPNQPLPGSRR